MRDIVHAVFISAMILLPIVAFIAGIIPVVSKRATTPTLQVSLPGMLIRRRSLISWMVVAWAAFTASMLTAATATGRFMFPNVLFEPPPTFKAGLPEEIQVGQVDERFKQSEAVWLVRDVDPVSGNTGIYALSTVCTHLGCTPNWLEAAQEFKCPCHGSGYYKNGINFEGPTPRPLERYAISLADDGQILVDKSRKFQYEKGEWANPQSFLKLADG
jgi:cytochrome b6-f complex iron-sulfur subunit